MVDIIDWRVVSLTPKERDSSDLLLASHHISCDNLPLMLDDNPVLNANVAASVRVRPACKRPRQILPSRLFQGKNSQRPRRSIAIPAFEWRLKAPSLIALVYATAAGVEKESAAVSRGITQPICRRFPTPYNQRRTLREYKRLRF
jgi:hypothetical protein